MTPYHLEVLLFLPMNKDLWTAADLQAILDHEDAEMQRKLRTVKMMPPYKIIPTAISHPMWKMLCYNVCDLCLFYLYYSVNPIYFEYYTNQFISNRLAIDWVHR